MQIYLEVAHQGFPPGSGGLVRHQTDAMFKVRSSQSHQPVILVQCQAKENHRQGVALEHLFMVEYLRTDPRQMGWIPFPTQGYGKNPRNPGNLVIRRTDRHQGNCCLRLLIRSSWQGSVGWEKEQSSPECCRLTEDWVTGVVWMLFFYAIYSFFRDH